MRNSGGRLNFKLRIPYFQSVDLALELTQFASLTYSRLNVAMFAALVTDMRISSRDWNII